MEQFLIYNYIASQNCLLASSLWESIVDTRNQAKYYSQRFIHYKYHDGKEGRPNWRDDLYDSV